MTNTTPATTEATITVKGHFGTDKTVTRKEYETIWADHVCGIYNLSETSEEFEETKAIVLRVRELANSKFDHILAREAAKK